MNKREEFEKWVKSLEKPITGMQTGKLNEYRSHMCWEVWQACQSLNDKRIAELEEKLKVAREDTARLDYIQSQTKGYGCGWIFRQSINGRGMRLHETSSINAFKNVREAIDEAREALKTIEG